MPEAAIPSIYLHQLAGSRSQEFSKCVELIRVCLHLHRAAVLPVVYRHHHIAALHLPCLVSERQSPPLSTPPSAVVEKLAPPRLKVSLPCNRLLMTIVSTHASNKLTLTKLGNNIINLHFMRTICMSYSKPAVLAKSSAYKAECRPNSKPSGRPCNPPGPSNR